MPVWAGRSMPTTPPLRQHRRCVDQHPDQHPLARVVLTTEVGRVSWQSDRALRQSGRRRGTIVEALNRDWDELVDRHRGSVRGWSQRHGALAECHSLADVLLAARGQPDAVLAALLTEVSKGDHLAARVVLQAMLGRIIRMAGRDPSAGVDDYVSALWCRICAYPLAVPADPDCGQPLDGHVQGGVWERRWLRKAR